MTNEIISAISCALYEEFGKNYKIYKEQVKQGFQTPCFSIVCISSSTQKGLGNRYIKKNHFCIHYFSDSDKFRYECQDVYERLESCLEYVSVEGDLVRGVNIRAEEISKDGILHVFVDYDIPILKVEQVERMGTMKAEVKVNG